MVDPEGHARILKNYWVHGKGALKVEWSTPGAFSRCVAELGKYVSDPKGLCAEYYHDATGEWPGAHSHDKH
jgi:hypothetical protein